MEQRDDGKFACAFPLTGKAYIALTVNCLSAFAVRRGMEGTHGLSSTSITPIGHLVFRIQTIPALRLEAMGLCSSLGAVSIASARIGISKQPQNTNGAPSALEICALSHICARCYFVPCSRESWTTRVWYTERAAPRVMRFFGCFSRQGAQCGGDVWAVILPKKWRWGWSRGGRD